MWGTRKHAVTLPCQEVTWYQSRYNSLLYIPDNLFCSAALISKVAMMIRSRYAVTTDFHKEDSVKSSFSNQKPSSALHARDRTICYLVRSHIQSRLSYVYVVVRNYMVCFAGPAFPAFQPAANVQLSDNHQFIFTERNADTPKFDISLMAVHFETCCHVHSIEFMKNVATHFRLWNVTKATEAHMQRTGFAGNQSVCTQFVVAVFFFIFWYREFFMSCSVWYATVVEIVV